MVQPVLKDINYWVPVPYHRLKLYKRGFNVVDTLFTPLFNTLNIPKLNLFNREKNTGPLFNKSYVKRREILSKTFGIQKSKIKKIENRSIVLVDDIVTSGATMEALIKHLPQNNSRVSCLSIVKVT